MIKAVVTDIEGTTSSLSFVKDVLFPYARTHIGDYLRQHADDPRVASLIEDVKKEANQELSLERVIDQLIRWIDEDKKITPLKSLQGMLWESGYKNGDFQGHIYEDAKEVLETWHKQGLRLYVYSSGSVYAQKLLFGYTRYGDLNYLFSGYFDTTIGAKIDSHSYKKIVETINLAPEQILFLSDIEKELDAAAEAGMKTIWLVRGGPIHNDASHAQVPDFLSIPGKDM
ncbi:MAG: acireductone synthase [Gammaproteobacteria bacterium]|nr:acireductone synthase [Gammaproteobacteria bacterium]